ncbi:hypothetical protein CKA32_007034 [Geitlerinema sp. FC II]|nr:hypothetical protein CKA32_007034 [Geitlerinema sp. FC II]
MSRQKLKHQKKSDSPFPIPDSLYRQCATCYTDLGKYSRII